MKRLSLALLALCSAALVMSCSKAEEVPSGIYLKSVFDGTSLRKTIYVFKDGQVAFNPKGDLENVDFGKMKVESPSSVGTYERKGNTLTIQWASGTTHTGELKEDKKGGFDYRTDAYAAVKPLKGNDQLQGEYYGGASIAGAYAAVTYTFDGKGGYQTNAAGVSVTSKKPDAETVGSTTNDSGSYQVQGTRISLKGSAGNRDISIYCIPIEGEQTPSMILLGGVVLTKK